MGAAEITEANHCFSIANDLVQESDPANLSQMFVACERLAQVAYLQGDEDGARGLLSTIICDGSPDVLPATLEAAKALLAKLDAVEETTADGGEESAPDGETTQDDDE